MMPDINISMLFKENEMLKKRVYFLEKWIERDSIIDFFECFIDTNGFRRIGVYGCGKYGKILLQKLSKCGIDYLCAIDNRSDEICTFVPVFAPDKTPDLDIIIVSTISITVDSIKKKIAHETLIARLDEVLDCANVFDLTEG